VVGGNIVKLRLLCWNILRTCIYETDWKNSVVSAVSYVTTGRILCHERLL